MSAQSRTVEDAIQLAVEAHRGQRYPSPEREPYVFHCLRVMLAQGDPTAQIVGMLHDVVEDTAVDLEHLAADGYPPEVVASIDCLSHRPGETYRHYIERVASNETASRVKLADLADNLANNRRSPNSPGNADRIKRYTEALAKLGAE